MGRAERSWGFQFQTVCALTSPSPQKVKHFTQSVSPNSLTEIWLGRQCSSPKENDPPLRQAARLRPRHAGVVSIHLRLFTCPPSTYRTRARRWREGGGEGSTRGHGPALVGPVRSYLASLSVFPLPGFSRLPKSCRHICSRLKKLCRQRPSRTASAAASADPTGNRPGRQMLRTAHFLSAAYPTPAFPELRPPAEASSPKLLLGSVVSQV